MVWFPAAGVDGGGGGGASALALPALSLPARRVWAAGRHGWLPNSEIVLVPVAARQGDARIRVRGRAGRRMPLLTTIMLLLPLLLLSQNENTKRRSMYAQGENSLVWFLVICWGHRSLPTVVYAEIERLRLLFLR